MDMTATELTTARNRRVAAAAADLRDDFPNSASYELAAAVHLDSLLEADDAPTRGGYTAIALDAADHRILFGVSLSECEQFAATYNLNGWRVAIIDEATSGFVADSLGT